MFSRRLVIRWIAEGKLVTDLLGMIELVVLILFAVTLLFLAIPINQQSTDRDYRLMLETEDAVIIGVVLVNYLLQIVRILLAIRRTQANCLLQEEMNHMDLNLPGEHSLVADPVAEERKVREKLIDRKKLLVRCVQEPNPSE